MAGASHAASNGANIPSRNGTTSTTRTCPAGRHLDAGKSPSAGTRRSICRLFPARRVNSGRSERPGEGCRKGHHPIASLRAESPVRPVARVRHSARFRKMHDEVIAEFRPRAEAALSLVDNTVKDPPFLVGEQCTIADIGCWGRMVFMAEGGFEIGHWPHLEAWPRASRRCPASRCLMPSSPARTESSRQRRTTCRNNGNSPTRRCASWSPHSAQRAEASAPRATAVVHSAQLPSFVGCVSRFALGRRNGLSPRRTRRAVRRLNNRPDFHIPKKRSDICGSVLGIGPEHRLGNRLGL